jgi:hypothetical protein
VLTRRSGLLNDEILLIFNLHEHVMCPLLHGRTFLESLGGSVEGTEQQVVGRGVSLALLQVFALVVSLLQVLVLVGPFDVLRLGHGTLLSRDVLLGRGAFAERLLRAG